MLTLLRLCVCRIRSRYIYDNIPETPTALLDRAQAHATNVAAEHFPDLPIETIEWEVSHRAQRQAGVTKYDPVTEAITITLTWEAHKLSNWVVRSP